MGYVSQFFDITDNQILRSKFGFSLDSDIEVSQILLELSQSKGETLEEERPRKRRFLGLKDQKPDVFNMNTVVTDSE